MFYGNQFTASTTPLSIFSTSSLTIINQLRKRESDTTAFLPIIHETITHLQTLDFGHHPYYLSKTDLHMGETPFTELLYQIMTLVFFKMCDILGPFSDPNNNSGFAVGGPKGCGKTNVMRLSIVLASILSPNIVSVYNNYQAEVVPSTPKSLLTAAMCLHDHSLNTEDIKHLSLNQIISRVNSQRKIILFDGDEISAAYKSEADSNFVHTDLATLVTGCFAVVIIADSTNRLREIVGGTYNNNGQYTKPERGSLTLKK